MKLKIIEACGRTLTLTFFIESYYSYMNQNFILSLVFAILFSISILIETAEDEKRDK